MTPTQQLELWRKYWAGEGVSMDEMDELREMTTGATTATVRDYASPQIAVAHASVSAIIDGHRWKLVSVFEDGADYAVEVFLNENTLGDLYHESHVDDLPVYCPSLIRQAVRELFARNTKKDPQPKPRVKS